MTRFNIFVDGSNLYGSLKNLDVFVAEYERFFLYILDQAVDSWRTSVVHEVRDIRLIRTLWYVVESIDDWALEDPKVASTVLQWFKADMDLRKKYLALAGVSFPGTTQETLAREAWNIFFNEIKVWYSGKRSQIEKQKNFYFGVESSTDFIDLIRSGHLKVDLLGKYVTEKGIDTSLAVDMLALVDTYDVALLISGDADSIPAIQKVKYRGKQVGVVEFIKGHPPEQKGRQSSSRLKAVADFVVPIYETDLRKENIATARITPFYT